MFEIGFEKTLKGTKIYSDSEGKFNKCKEELTKRSYQFYTYRAKDEQILTVYLYDLPKVKVLEIKDELATSNIFPIDITEATTKYSAEDDAVYKL